MDSDLHILFCLVFLWVSIWLVLFVPAGMATRRGRNRLIWMMISLCFSPVLAILLLAALGHTRAG